MSQAVSFAKRMVVWNAAVPGLLLAYDAWRGNLGGNPINFSIRTTGMLSLIMLVLSLAVTPLVRWAGWGWLGPSRRALGLFAFAYGLAGRNSCACWICRKEMAAPSHTGGG